MNRRWVCLLVVATGCMPSRATGPVLSQPEVARFSLEPNAVVEQVIDGDTIEVRVAGRLERIRLLGIDTPETQHPDRPAECLGPEATAFTRLLLPVGTPVRLERDIIGRDHFGRLLAHVHRASDGLSVNHALVRQGYASVLIVPPNTAHADTLLEAAVSAHADGLGVWARCVSTVRATNRRVPARTRRTRTREPPRRSPTSMRRAAMPSARHRRVPPAAAAPR
jgi:micrococcal nuclease